MKGSRIALVVIVAVVLLAGGWWLFSRGQSSAAINLIDRLEAATKQPAAGTFEVAEIELNGEKRRAIVPPAASRITYKVQVPDDAWLRVAVGTKAESWTQEGNGSYFFVGVSDGRSPFDMLFSQHVNPFANAGDRKWIPVWVDLSAYAGEEIELIFNTRTSPDRTDDPRNDAPLWGAPEIIVR